MKYLISAVLPLLFLILAAGCKDPAGAGDTPPANLTLQPVVSTDGSGNVTFTATAENVVSFDFEFGNGEVKTGTNGNVAYQYLVSGTYSVTVTAIGSSGLTSKKTVDIQVTVRVVEPGLVWSDEFNSDGAPDPAKWGYDLGNNNGWGNSELQFYTNLSKNVFVQGGVLKITAIKEAYSGFGYTSARILTNGKYSFKYGKVEISAKLPATAGTWPALWMLGSDFATNTWPACGEIDIMEHKGNDLNRIFSTLHYPGHFGGSGNGNSLVVPGVTTGFHKYTLEWTASSIKMYVDDMLVHSVTNSGGIPFNHEFFLIFNLAIGGTFGGNVDAAFTSDTMEVDYVRVYSL